MTSLVSSPNTPGLRSLQSADRLTDILSSVVSAANTAHRSVPIMCKVSPDHDSEEEVSGICDAIKASKCAGVIVG